jgi:hypothetical protein
MPLVVTTNPSILMPYFIYFVRGEGFNSAEPQISVPYSVTPKPPVRDFPSARQSHMIPSNQASSYAENFSFGRASFVEKRVRLIKNIGGLFFEDGVWRLCGAVSDKWVAFSLGGSLQNGLEL